MDEHTFPIHSSDRKALPLAPTSIPFWIVEQHERQARSNHAQSVQRLADRGGCSWRELLAILTDRPFWDVSAMSDSAAMVEVVSIVGKADPEWIENWRSVCSARANKRSPKAAPFEIAKS